jgi:predicted membrane chloride channel (bestrophin family)
MKLTRRELRDVAISLRLSKSERDNLTRLTQHYQTSNADLIAWLVASELERIHASPNGPVKVLGKPVPQLADEQSIRDTLAQLVEQVAKLSAVVAGEDRSPG